MGDRKHHMLISAPVHIQSLKHEEEVGISAIKTLLIRKQKTLIIRQLKMSIIRQLKALITRQLKTFNIDAVLIKQ